MGLFDDSIAVPEIDKHLPLERGHFELACGS